MDEFNLDKIINEFPQLQQKVHNHPLTYLDNAATTLKPRAVIDAITTHYQLESANIHRGVHFLSEQASIKYEITRKIVQKFINAKHQHEIIFTKGTTDAINIVAQSFAKRFLNKDDEIVISTMEHHSNIVPWQMVCQQYQCKLRIIPIDDRGDLILEEAEKIINKNTKLVSLVYVSNSLGTINPIEKIIDITKSHGARILIDGAQAVQHLPINVQNLGVDFFAFSSHKIFGPTGVGVLYGKEELLCEMPPAQGGGDMVEKVTFEQTTYAPLPEKFEAGTPHIAGIIALKEALNFVTKIGLNRIEQHENAIIKYALKALSDIKGLNFIGEPLKRSAVISFTLDNVHPHDVGTLCDQSGVALRTGHHCTQPIMQHFKVPATTRASFALYNTFADVDRLVIALRKTMEFFI